MQKTNVKRVAESSSKQLDRKRLVAFFSGVKEELKKVEWIDKGQLRNYTKIVIIGTFLFGMVVYFMDLLIQSCLHVFHLFMNILVR